MGNEQIPSSKHRWSAWIGRRTGAFQSSKAITTTYYAIYVVASVAFTVLTSRKFAKLSSIVGEVLHYKTARGKNIEWVSITHTLGRMKCLIYF